MLCFSRLRRGRGEQLPPIPPLDAPQTSLSRALPGSASQTRPRVAPRSARSRALPRLLVLLTLALAGCGHHFELRAPERFVELDPSAQERMGFAYRATTANGAVIGVREIDNDRHASAEFWVEAIRNRVRRAGGYALVSETDVRSADGTAGHQLRFGRDEGRHPYDYWITVFVTHDRLFLVEAGGRRDHFETERESIERAITAIHLH